MSKHFFTRTTTKGTFEIHIGWDNPLNEYFCNIFQVSESDDGRPCEPEWSSLYDKDLLTPLKIEEKCKEYGIELPSGLMDEVISDRFTHTPNRIVHWDT